MSRYIFRIIVIISCISLSSCATLSDSADFYRQASLYEKRGDNAAVFMALTALMNEGSRSRYSPQAAFGIAEYYFETNDYIDASAAFRKYLKKYPDDPGVIFAKSIIYKMATQIKPDKDMSSAQRYLLENIREKVLSQPKFIFFGKRKRFFYRSVFGNVYIAFNYEDRVKVIRNGELFLELLP